VWIWEQIAIISLYSNDWLVFITETESVYCAVRNASLYIIQTIRTFQYDSVSSSRLSPLISIYTFLLPEEQKAQSGDLPKKQHCFGSRRDLDRKVLSLLIETDNIYGACDDPVSTSNYLQHKMLTWLMNNYKGAGSGRGLILVNTVRLPCRKLGNPHNDTCTRLQSVTVCCMCEVYRTVMHGCAETSCSDWPQSDPHVSVSL
jgi:hypothetical protein